DLRPAGPGGIAIIGVRSAAPGDFYNAGTLTSEASSFNSVGLALHNTGAVALHSGELDFLGSDAAGPTSSGAITGDPGTLLLFGAGSAVAFDFAPGSSIAADQFLFGGGSHLVEGSYRANATGIFAGAPSVTFAASAPAPQVGALTVNTAAGAS